MPSDFPCAGRQGGREGGAGCSEGGAGRSEGGARAERGRGEGQARAASVRLARAGLADEDDGLVLFHHLEEIVALLPHRKLLAALRPVHTEWMMKAHEAGGGKLSRAHEAGWWQRRQGGYRVSKLLHAAVSSAPSARQPRVRASYAHVWAWCTSRREK